MTAAEQEKFKTDFKAIRNLKERIQPQNNYIAKLSHWDKSGSHEKLILSVMDEVKPHKEELRRLMRGKSYSWWRDNNQKLSRLSARLKKAKTEVTMEKIKAELEKMAYV